MKAQFPTLSGPLFSGPWLRARYETDIPSADGTIYSGFAYYGPGVTIDCLSSALRARRPRRLDGSYADERNEV